MKQKFSRSRRALLQGSACGFIALAGAALPLELRGADKKELPHVTEDDPTAKALKYKQDAAQSERKDAKQFCNTCRYFKGKKGDAWGPCDLFPGKAVNAQGWCNVWAQKT